MPASTLPCGPAPLSTRQPRGAGPSPERVSGRIAGRLRLPPTVRRALLLSIALALAAPGAAAARDFPRDFLWGTAIAGFQTEAGGHPDDADKRSDWWVWSHDPENVAQERVSGDRVERGPGHWRLYRRDAALARDRLGANAFRLSIEWSRLFPRSTGGARTPRRLDRLVNQRAARHYAAE